MKTTTNLLDGVIDCYESEGYENRALSQVECIKMLDAHGLCWHLTEDGLYANDLEPEDSNADGTTLIKDWTLFDMLAFLGY